MRFRCRPDLLEDSRHHIREVAIKMDSRRVIEYFLSPLVQLRAENLQER